MAYICPDCDYESENPGSCPNCETPLLKREGEVEDIEGLQDTGSTDVEEEDIEEDEKEWK